MRKHRFRAKNYHFFLIFSTNKSQPPNNSPKNRLATIILVLMAIRKLFEFEGVEDVASCNGQLKPSLARRFIGLENNFELVPACLCPKPVCCYGIKVIGFAGRITVFSIRQS